ERHLECQTSNPFSSNNHQNVQIRRSFAPENRHNQLPAQIPAGTYLGPRPMELDFTTNGNTPRRLTPQERTDRINNGLCLYCGEKGHAIANCPTAPQNKPRTIGIRNPKTQSINSLQNSSSSVLQFRTVPSPAT